MFIYDNDFILTPETAEKIKRKIEVLRMKADALTKITVAFEKYNGKVLNKRVFDGVNDAFNAPGLNVEISTNSSGFIEMYLYGEKLTYSEKGTFFCSSSIKAGDRLDFSALKAESDKLINRYNQRATEAENALKTLKTELKKALKAYKTLKSIADSLPYEVKDEFKLLKELY